MSNEADTCRKFVVPKLQAVGWDNDPRSIAEQRTVTDGRVIPVGKGFVRKPPKRVDYLLRTLWFRRGALMRSSVIWNLSPAVSPGDFDALICPSGHATSIRAHTGHTVPWYSLAPAPLPGTQVARTADMIRKLASGKFRLYSRKPDPRTGRRRNLGTFGSREAAEKHERAVQYFKRRGG